MTKEKQDKSGPNGAASNKDRYYMRSLARGLTVLLALAETSHPLGLTELSRATGNNNATTTRCCHTLIAMGFVRRDTQRRFHLTPKVLTLGHAAISRLGWRQVAQHYMTSFSQKINETVNLSVLDDHEILYVGRINTDKILSYDLRIGSKLPLHCTSMGKVLVAFNPSERIETIVRGIEFEQLTHRTITNPRDYMVELDKVREQGYALNDEELSVGLRSVAAPILDQEGCALAAMNIAVPTKRVSREELEKRLAPRVMETARQIQKAVAAMDTG